MVFWLLTHSKKVLYAKKHREREAVLKDGVWVRRKRGRCGKLCPMHLKAAALYSMTQWAYFEEIEPHTRKGLEAGI